MVTKYGFSEKLGPVNYSSSDEVFLGKDFTSKQSYSEGTAAAIDAEVKAIVEEAYEAANAIDNNDMPNLCEELGDVLMQVVFHADIESDAGRFTMEDGTRQDVDMMHSEEYTYLEDDLATGFIKYYKDRKYAFVAMLPNDGVTVSQYVDSLTGEHLRELLNNPQDVTVFASIPKFETEYDIEMSEVLQEMGMTDAFDWQVADFSKLGTYNVDGMNICINRMLHKTFISVCTVICKHCKRVRNGFHVVF